MFLEKTECGQVGYSNNLRYQPRPNFYADVPGIPRYEFSRKVFVSRAQLKPDHLLQKMYITKDRLNAIYNCQRTTLAERQSEQSRMDVCGFII